MAINSERYSIMSPKARIQVPWVKVTIENFTFGIFDKKETTRKDDNGQYYTAYDVKYPNFIQSLSIKKVNGQVNQYTLSISYPVRHVDDPNFFEKIFSSVNKTRKIVFSYGDMSMPTYVYKDEEALIVSSKSNFDLPNAVINYTVEAVSTSTLNLASNRTFPGGLVKPSDRIKKLVLDTSATGLNRLFTGINAANVNYLIDGDDKEVYIESKTNISCLEYINYLVGCMIPASNTTNDSVNNDIYALSIHDDTTYDRLYSSDFNELNISGPYLKVKKVTRKIDKADALRIDVGFGNTGTIVRKLRLSDNEGYAMMYDYNSSLDVEAYTQKLNSLGKWESVYAPTVTSKNDQYLTRAEDLRWWTNVTKFPITATLEIQGLIRAAQLMSYVRLNVIFPGGRKHIASGLYLITQQLDVINSQGYVTQLGLTKISGDEEGPLINDAD